MELKDEIKLPAKLDYVYDCLNNLEVLKICIPGCEELVENKDGSHAGNGIGSGQYFVEHDQKPAGFSDSIGGEQSRNLDLQAGPVNGGEFYQHGQGRDQSQNGRIGHRIGPNHQPVAQKSLKGAF